MSPGPLDLSGDVTQTVYCMSEQILSTHRGVLSAHWGLKEMDGFLSFSTSHQKVMVVDPVMREAKFNFIVVVIKAVLNFVELGGFILEYGIREPC